MALAQRRADEVIASGRARDSASPDVDSVATPLTVVHGRRSAARFVVALSVLISAIMLAAAVLHTQLAERQLHIDRLERSVLEAQDQFDVLRRQRAELRAPNRLATEARRLGMAPASVTEFVQIDAASLAVAIAATGRPDTEGMRLERREPLDQFVLVKRVSNSEP